jgi:hypothetical protein
MALGCSFDPSPGGGGGGGPDGAADRDAPRAIDAAPELVDTLTIQGTGEIALSTFVPLAGVTYRLRATGFVDVATGLASDADYFGFPGSVSDYTTDNTVDMGLGIDDSTLDRTKTRWGPYTDTHVYEVAYIGTGMKLRAQYEDNFYGNNAGTMMLQIFR